MHPPAGIHGWPLLSSHLLYVEVGSVGCPFPVHGLVRVLRILPRDCWIGDGIWMVAIPLLIMYRLGRWETVVPRGGTYSAVHNSLAAAGMQDDGDWARYATLLWAGGRGTICLAPHLPFDGRRLGTIHSGFSWPSLHCLVCVLQCLVTIVVQSIVPYSLNSCAGVRFRLSETLAVFRLKCLQ